MIPIPSSLLVALTVIGEDQNDVRIGTRLKMKSSKATDNMLILTPSRFKQSSYAGPLYTVAKRQM